MLARDCDDPKAQTIPLLRYFTLFNVEQVEGCTIESGRPVETTCRIDEAESVLSMMPNPPKLVRHHSSAFYRPDLDAVAMPDIQKFRSAESYYATLYHELGHATGHPTRLNRRGVAEVTVFGSSDYSREELVAELASAFVCAEIGLDNSLIDAAASYIDGWMKALSNDPRAVVHASSQARHAADYIFGRLAETP